MQSDAIDRGVATDHPVPLADGADRPVRLGDAARRLGGDLDEWRSIARLLPVRWPQAYLELAAGPRGEPIRRMGVPHSSEAVADPLDVQDPVGEAGLTPAPFVVRKHADRVILLVTATCHFYCRFCFRRSFPDGEHSGPSAAELAAALEWVRGATDVREVILSGGDPLTLPDARLAAIVAELASIEHLATLRVHTRAPVHAPSRVTPGLVAALRSRLPVRVVTHFNHPVELTDASRAAVATLRAAGFDVLNQSVLLAGVNDDADVLAALARALDVAGVAPYYLHHLDRVPGSARFRVAIDRGLAIDAALARLLPERLHAAYVIDVPDGTGKIPVASLVRVGARTWRAPSGLEIADAAAPEA